MHKANNPTVIIQGVFYIHTVTIHKTSLFGRFSFDFNFDDELEFGV